jgi:hypothetical protein
VENKKKDYFSRIIVLKWKNEKSAVLQKHFIVLGSAMSQYQLQAEFAQKY